MSFLGSIIAIVFGIFWTIMAFGMTARSPFGGIGLFFPLFGVIFVIYGIAQAIYHYKNATGQDRYSIFDITDSSEEGDPSDKWIKREIYNEMKKDRTNKGQAEVNYCPYCGIKLENEYMYCPKCGKKIK